MELTEDVSQDERKKDSLSETKGAQTAPDPDLNFDAIDWKPDDTTLPLEIEEGVDPNIEITFICDLESEYDSRQYPYVYMNVEELSLVKSLDHWSNRKVRTLGYLTCVNNEWRLNSYEEGGYSLVADVTRLPQHPSLNDVFEVWGEITLITSKDSVQPCVQIDFHRYFKGDDVQQYEKDMESFKIKYVPQHFKSV